jgi:hypothetical protein
VIILGTHAELKAQNPAGYITDDNYKNLKTEEAARELAEQTKTRKAIYVIVGIIGIILLALYLTDYIDRGSSQNTVRETPFQEIIQEKEAKSVPAVSPAPDSSKDSSETVLQSVTVPESLVLRAVALDSVWINITLDDKPTRKGYVLEGGKREWIAKNEITLSISDAGKMKFTLNGMKYSVGKRGQRVRGFVINADTLARLQQ